jgi:hypothetical protein
MESQYRGVIEHGYVKVYRGDELIAAGVLDARVTGTVRDIEFMDEAHRKVNRVRMTAMRIMAETCRAVSRINLPEEL